ncbi:MAG: type 1 glutamine amidotransferase domain-containing protein [Bacteroidales bacterium]
MKPKKILFVLSNHDKLGDSGKPTGWWVSEAAHPWSVVSKAGYEVDFVSPLGGEPVMTGENSNDPIDRAFLDNQEVKQKIKNTLTPAQVNVDQYCCIHYVGGHGAMWDFPDNTELSKIAAKMWDQGKVVSAICHGVAALLNVKLHGGDLLIKGKNLTSFTDMEEKANNTCEVVPYFLQCELMLRGSIFHIAKNWADNVQVHERLITGQNPQSGLSVGKAMVALLEHLKM